MYRLIACFLFVLHGSMAQVAPFAGVPPVVPPGLGVPPLGNGVRNPYYNAAGSIPIVAYSNQPPVEGTYAFSFATADGKQVQENGFLKDAFIDNAGEPQGTQVVQGSYSYISPEGTPIQVSYVADENGFRPSGVHIPADGTATAPLPVPPPLNPAFEGYRADPRRPFDPAYNQYNPYYRNYNNNANYYDKFNPYHGSQGPYDGYNGYNNYNRYNGLNRYNHLNHPSRYFSGYPYNSPYNSPKGGAWKNVVSKDKKDDEKKD